MTILELVQKYEKNKDYYRSLKYNESQVRQDFLDPFFELLGWDLKNNLQKSYNEREVLLEEGLKDQNDDNTKKPDYTFRLFSFRKFFLEAKKPNVNIIDLPDPAKQVRRYGYTAKLTISLLSNFESLAIYDCSEEVNETDISSKARIKLYHYTEYFEKFEEIRELVGRNNVYNGNFDKTWSVIENKVNLYGIDKKFLNQINIWRLDLGKEIIRIKPLITEENLNDLVQSYLNSIIFLRVCEDRNIEKYKTLLNFSTTEDFNALINKFSLADRRYNSGLFSQKYKDEIIKNSQSVFWKIINSLYYPQSTYSFSVFSSDILGNIYEAFLSKKISNKGGTLQIIDKPENENRDVVTTPTNIIKDLIRETLIPFCSGKNDEEIFDIKIADIACGSGAFLLEAFQSLSDILIDYYVINDKSNLIETSLNTFKLKFSVKRKILENCIFGYDRDYNAVAAAKFGLLLKLLEDENENTLLQSSALLPNLDKNIIYANSLINFEYCSEKESSEINPYNFGSSKFDIILGNPPYMSIEDMKNITPLEIKLYKKYYLSAYKQFDKYFLFIERGISLLKENGYLGYIIPNKISKVGAGEKIRQYLIERRIVKKFINFGAIQLFSGKSTYTSLLICQNCSLEKIKYLEVNDYDEWKTRKIEDEDYNNIPYTKLKSDVWVLVPKSLESLYYKTVKKSQELSKIIGKENIYNGIQTSANNTYIHTPIKEDELYVYFKYKNKEWKIEKELTRPYYKTENKIENKLNPYKEFLSNSIVFYPYKKIKNKLEFISIEEMQKKYPEAFKFILTYKSELDNLKRNIMPKPKTSDEWYRYGRHQNLESCEVPQKIVVGVLSQGNKYALDFKQTLISSGGTAGYCNIVVPENSKYSIFYLQAVLNSKYMEWIASIYGEIFSGGFIARGTKVLNRLPIREINFDDERDKEIHDIIAKKQKTLIDLKKQIDNNKDDIRIITQIERKFDIIEAELKNCLKILYDLGDEDVKIPIISELY